MLITFRIIPLVRLKAHLKASLVACVVVVVEIISNDGCFFSWIDGDAERTNREDNRRFLRDIC